MGQLLLRPEHSLAVAQGTVARKKRTGAAVELSPTVTCPLYITFVAIGVHVLRFDDAESTTLCPKAAEMPTDEV